MFRKQNLNKWMEHFIFFLFSQFDTPVEFSERASGGPAGNKCRHGFRTWSVGEEFRFKSLISAWDTPEPLKSLLGERNFNCYGN